MCTEQDQDPAYEAVYARGEVEQCRRCFGVDEVDIVLRHDTPYQAKPAQKSSQKAREAIRKP